MADRWGWREGQSALADPVRSRRRRSSAPTSPCALASRGRNWSRRRPDDDSRPTPAGVQSAAAAGSPVCWQRPSAVTREVTPRNSRGRRRPPRSTRRRRRDVTVSDRLTASAPLAPACTRQSPGARADCPPPAVPHSLPLADSSCSRHDTVNAARLTHLLCSLRAGSPGRRTECAGNRINNRRLRNPGVQLGCGCIFLRPLFCSQLLECV